VTQVSGGFFASLLHLFEESLSLGVELAPRILGFFAGALDARSNALRKTLDLSLQRLELLAYVFLSRTLFGSVFWHLRFPF
jgi:hypothetical protein